MDCNSDGCEAHVFLVEAIKELKNTSGRLLDSQQTLELTVVRLTENLNELKKVNSRIDSILLDQKQRDQLVDKELEAQRDFMNKAVGVLGAISFFLPIVLFAVGILLKG